MSNLEEVKKLNESVAAFLSDFDPSTPDGRYDLEKGAYALVQSYTSKNRSEAKYESHKAYLDVQYVVSGMELISVIDIDKLTPCTEYKPDIVFYNDSLEGIDHLLRDGDFMILYPKDGHAPGICVNEPMPIRKIVAKIPVE